MDRTPEAYIRRQCSRRRHERVIPPCVTNTLATLPVTTRYDLPGPVSQWSLGYHTGEDHAAPVGAFVNSVSWGTVVCVATWTGPGQITDSGPVRQWGDSYGTHVVVRLASGVYDAGYCHLSAVLVKPGDRVRPGQTIGYVGHTGGDGNFGSHLHLEARPAGGRFGSDVHPLLVKRMEVKT